MYINTKKKIYIGGTEELRKKDNPQNNRAMQVLR